MEGNRVTNVFFSIDGNIEFMKSAIISIFQRRKKREQIRNQKVSIGLRKVTICCAPVSRHGKHPCCFIILNRWRDSFEYTLTLVLLHSSSSHLQFPVPHPNSAIIIGNKRLFNI